LTSIANVSAKGGPSLSLGQRPRIKYAFEQALKARLNNVGRRNQAQRPTPGREIDSRIQRLS
jgi:hypothetical protein